jgi:ATP-dependent Lon protease
MSITSAVGAITLDELGTILLPAHLMIAIDEVDIEYSIWERRRAMNADPQHAAFPTTSSPNERILPVVVLGDMVAPPGIYPLQLSNIRPGRSNRAIRAALESDNEVLMIFVPELEIANYRTTEPQPLPSIGVMARLADVAPQPDGALEVVMDVTTRATVTARLQHDPYYLATCVPHPDPEVTNAEAHALMEVVKAQVEAMAQTLAPNSTPEQVEEALTFMRQIDHPGQLADFITYSPTFTFADRIAILNTLDPLERLRLVQRILGA